MIHEWLFSHVPVIIAEHLVWIIIGGILLALTGFTPEEWITQAINLLRTTSVNTLIRTARIVTGVLGMLFIVFALRGLLQPQRGPPAATGFTQQQVDDRVKASLAPLQSDLASKITELNNVHHQLLALQSQLSSTQTELNDIQHQAQTRISPEMAIDFANALGLSGVLQTIPRTFILLTSSPDNESLRNDLQKILNAARGISGGKSPLLPMGLPDYNNDLDAPRLTGSNKNGITIHGRNQAGNFLMRVFAGDNCLILHQTGQTPDELLSYIKRIHQSSDVNDIAWIEIGSGAVLHSSGCLDH